MPYSDIKATTTLLNDGVHLKCLGGNILLSTITGSLETYAKVCTLLGGCGEMTHPDQFIHLTPYYVFYNN